MNRSYAGSTIVLLYLLLWGTRSSAQSSEKHFIFHTPFYSSLEWENPSPSRGGRATAVVGFPNNNFTYLMGTAGGGLWKTVDAGISWQNISDGFFRSASIGAIAIAPGNERVMYVGTGESAIRGVMTFAGDGVYKTTDGGKTWSNVGLWDSRHIASIVVHPTNGNIVYVAVQGAAFGASEDRGVYKSIDGGENWTKVLFYNETTGISDLSMDPNDPNILFAALWDHQRTPWQIRSGGEGSGLYRSDDGGNSWHRLSQGLPAKMGKTAISVSPVDSKIVYAAIESSDGLAGIYQSTDGGESWTQTSADRQTIARSWYYTELVADPVDAQTLYVLNAPLLKSEDGGRSFKIIKTPHSDHHDIWINPTNTQNLIVANDGGAAISFNGGMSWSSQDNQPTGQFYRVTTDHLFPYHIYAAQQDNTTIAFEGNEKDVKTPARPYSVGGGESAFIAMDKDDPNMIFSGSYQGNITSYNHQTGIVKDIMAYPTLGLGAKPKKMKYRFNWNAPIVVDPFDKSVVYHAANVLLKTTDQGLNWEEISPDLTKNEQDKQGVGGYPFTNEAAGGENYNTISYVACAPLEQGVIWVGTDDGNLQLTKNGGKSWTNITPPDLGEGIINSIDLSSFSKGTAYIAVTKYKYNDLSPLIYTTTDYGNTWKKITKGIAREDYVMVVREDPKVLGILYAGTLSGIYISTDNGAIWQRFQLNLPVCPITDLTFQNNDLIVSTGGRGIWVLSDLNAVQQGYDQLLSGKMMLFEPSPTVRLDYEGKGGDVFHPKKIKQGLMIDYFLPGYLKPGEELKLNILDKKGKMVASFSSEGEDDYVAYEGGPHAPSTLSTDYGVNRFIWDMHRTSLPGVKGVYVQGDYRGALVAPEEYSIELLKGKRRVATTCQILPDPRIHATKEDYQNQELVTVSIDETVREMHQMVINMSTLKEQLDFLNKYLERIPDTENLVNLGNEISFRITKWEALLIQPNQKTQQDIVNYPSALNAELLALRARVDGNDPVVTSGAKKRLNDLLKQWDAAKDEISLILERDVAHFNKVYRKKGIPALVFLGTTPSDP